jgi:hypothetical protein
MRVRPMLARSPLFDLVGVTRDVEEAFRGMWRRYCDAHAG